MKKKEEKRKPERNRRDRENTFDSLDSQLGSFGLEPPKRYRPDQEIQSYNGDNDRKPERKRKIKAIPKYEGNNSDRILTPDEKRREQNKRRKQKKMIRRIVSIILLSVAIIAFLVVLSLTVLFKIDTIKITGCESYTNKEIIAVLPFEKEENLFIVDTKSASKKLEENLPYIYNAEIKRKLPSTIEINVTEVEKVYAAQNEDKTYTLLDKDMKVLETNVVKRPKGSIVIRKLSLTTAEPGRLAEFSQEQQKTDIINLTSIIDSMQLDEITAICSVDINSNYMTYDKRIKYILGTTENLESKVYSALAATEKLNESDPDAQGEMTVTGGKQVYFTKK